MIDSYRAPADLAAARRRTRAAAAARCRRLGIDIGGIDLPIDGTDRHSGSLVVLDGADRDSGSLVVLDGTKPFDDAGHAITAATACIIADFVLWRWDRSSLRALADRLPAEAALVFLEPTADLGWRRLVHRVGRGPARLAFGHNFEADVPAELRAAGLVVTTTDRFSLGPAGIRSYVWGQAEHITPAR